MFDEDNERDEIAAYAAEHGPWAALEQYGVRTRYDQCRYSGEEYWYLTSEDDIRIAETCGFDVGRRGLLTER